MKWTGASDAKATIQTASIVTNSKRGNNRHHVNHTGSKNRGKDSNQGKHSNEI